MAWIELSVRKQRSPLGLRNSRVRRKFRTHLMQIYLLITKRQRNPTLAEINPLHSQHRAVEPHTGFDIGNG